MTKQITNEEAFRCSAPTFAVSASSTGYTLEFSVDGKTWTAWKEPVPAGEQLVVYGVVPSMFYRFKGSTETLTMIF